MHKKLKIQYCSDLHLEFAQNEEYILEKPIIPVADILILAGDIIPFRILDHQQDFFDYVSRNFEFVYWIPGNHEYYHGDIAGRQGQFEEEIRHNVKLLNNRWVQHGDTRLIFSTLWTRISQEYARSIENGMNDFHLIKQGEARFTVVLYNQLFEENMNFIREAVANNESKNCIVITHHVPTFNNYPSEYLGSSLNEAFAVDLNDFIEAANIDYWIYGHHHRNVSEFEIGKTKLVTNQLGYVSHGEQRGYSTNKSLTV